MKNQGFKRTIVILTVVALTVFALAGCTTNAGSSSGSSNNAVTPDVDYTVPVELPDGTDAVAGLVLRDGDKVTVYDYDLEPFTFKEGSIEHIINLWPANTAGSLALGAESYFIANIGMTSPYQALMFPDYAALPSVSMTTAGSNTINSEAILALEPDMIISHPTSIDQWRALEEESGIDLPVININFTNYDEMKTTYSILGAILGGRVQENATVWGEMLQANIDRIAKGLEGVTERPIVFYSSGGENMGGTLGMNSLEQTVVANEWTTNAGGTYWPKWILEEGKTITMDGNAVNAEALLEYPPNKIFIGGGQNAAMDAILAGTAESPWTEIVKELGTDNVKYMPYALFDWARFGAESALMVLWAAREIHPDIFADSKNANYIDIATETKAFYKDFVGYDISDENVSNILAGLPPAGYTPPEATN